MSKVESSKSDDSFDRGCGFGCGFGLAILFIMAVFGSCIRDSGYQYERGRQDAIREGVIERQGDK